MLPKTVNSTLTGKPAELVRKLPAAPLIAAYAERFGYDASQCFDGLDEIGLYECGTGMRFYYPLSIAGPESLYRCLEKFDWNYKEAKWEHDVALKYVEPGMKIIDVGCGEGSFLTRALAKGAVATGIEFNKSAGAKAAAKGAEIRAEMLSDHAKERPGYYDIVTSFQVLEHVVDPGAFLTGCLAVLKPGGLLLIGVPNDDSFVGMDEEAVLNQPPHHMSLWTRESLEAVAGLYGLEVTAMEIEPLAELAWYQAFMERKYLPLDWKRKLYYKLGGHKVVQQAIEAHAHTIAGHTILAAYCKP